MYLPFFSLFFSLYPEINKIKFNKKNLSHDFPISLFSRHKSIHKFVSLFWSSRIPRVLLESEILFRLSERTRFIRQVLALAEYKNDGRVNDKSEYIQRQEKQPVIRDGRFGFRSKTRYFFRCFFLPVSQWICYGSLRQLFLIWWWGVCWLLVTATEGALWLIHRRALYMYNLCVGINNHMDCTSWTHIDGQCCLCSPFRWIWTHFIIMKVSIVHTQVNIGQNIGP